ncbi:hypothetical protein [Streptomyces sp. DSM 41033]|uniref:hypothetical protein n=1 Tax=Streptomyces sp. DSM 41033 TaxID=3448655 RepID=UPI00403FF544
MIRIVTKARLARLAAEAEASRRRAVEVQEKADAVSSTYFRTVTELTARAVQAEQGQMVLAGVVTELRAELAAAELSEVVLLLRYGQPRSIHRSAHEAKAAAAAEGADPGGWRVCSRAPSGSDAWATVAFILDDATGSFTCSLVPALPVSGGAG